MTTTEASWNKRNNHYWGILKQDITTTGASWNKTWPLLGHPETRHNHYWGILKQDMTTTGASWNNWHNHYWGILKQDMTTTEASWNNRHNHYWGILKQNTTTTGASWNNKQSPIHTSCHISWLILNGTFKLIACFISHTHFEVPVVIWSSVFCASGRVKTTTNKTSRQKQLHWACSRLWLLWKITGLQDCAGFCKTLATP